LLYTSSCYWCNFHRIHTTTHNDVTHIQKPATTAKLEEGEISPVSQGKNARNEDPPNWATHIANGNPLNMELTLHNSFELLEAGVDFTAGEDRKTDGKLPLITEADLMSNENEVEVSIENVSFLHPIVSEAQGKLKSGPSLTVAGATSKPITGEAFGKLPFTSPSSLV